MKEIGPIPRKLRFFRPGHPTSDNYFCWILFRNFSQILTGVRNLNMSKLKKMNDFCTIS